MAIFKKKLPPWEGVELQRKQNVFRNQWSSGNNVGTCTIGNSEIFENKNHPSAWHWHFTSLDAKNSTDMIKIVGLGSSSLSKSPGPTWQDNRFLAIFYYQGTRRWNIYLKHLAGEKGRYTQLVALCLQLLGDCCKGHQYRGCWAWGEMNQLLKS